MRVIRTELYFDGNDIKGRDNPEAGVPGIAAAWLRSSEIPLDVKELSERVFDPKLPQALLDVGKAGYVFKSFADLCVRGITDPSAVQDVINEKWSVENGTLVDSILNSDIVIENNLDFITVKDAFKNASYVSIGMLVGYQALSTPIILISVPAGIFVVGVAIAMTQVTQKIITDHFDKRNPGKKVK
jgi:hypothetical protein